MENIKRWLKAAGIRAIKTFFQTFVSMIPAHIAITDISWWGCASVALTAAVVSLMMSTYGLPELKENEKGDEENDN